MSVAIPVYDYSRSQKAQTGGIKFDHLLDIYVEKSWSDVGWVINNTVAELRRKCQRSPVRIEVIGNNCVLSKWTLLKMDSNRIQIRQPIFSEGNLTFDLNWKDANLEVYVW